MENEKEGFWREIVRYWSWDDTWGLLLIAVIVTVCILALTALTANHDIRFYYVGHESCTNSICIKASRNWISDDAVFCSDDVSKITEALKKMNEDLRSSKH